MGWAWVTARLCSGSPADGTPAFVLLQLCPVIEAAFEDMYADLLRLVRGKCTALSHLFPVLLGRPPGLGSVQGHLSSQA